MESRLTAKGGQAKEWRDWVKGKKTHGHGQQCGDCKGDGIIRGIKDKGK